MSIIIQIKKQLLLLDIAQLKASILCDNKRKESQKCKGDLGLFNTTEGYNLMGPGFSVLTVKIRWNIHRKPDVAKRFSGLHKFRFNVFNSLSLNPNLKQEIIINLRYHDQLLNLLAKMIKQLLSFKKKASGFPCQSVDEASEKLRI